MTLKDISIIRKDFGRYANITKTSINIKEKQYGKVSRDSHTLASIHQMLMSIDFNKLNDKKIGQLYAIVYSTLHKNWIQFDSYLQVLTNYTQSLQQHVSRLELM